MRATGLDKKDFFGKSDPFLKFYRANGDGRYLFYYQCQPSLSVLAWIPYSWTCAWFQIVLFINEKVFLCSAVFLSVFFTVFEINWLELISYRYKQKMWSMTITGLHQARCAVKNTVLTEQMNDVTIVI